MIATVLPAVVAPIIAVGLTVIGAVGLWLDRRDDRRR